MPEPLSEFPHLAAHGGRSSPGESSPIPRVPSPRIRARASVFLPRAAGVFLPRPLGERAGVRGPAFIHAPHSPPGSQALPGPPLTRGSASSSPFTRCHSSPASRLPPSPPGERAGVRGPAFIHAPHPPGSQALPGPPLPRGSASPPCSRAATRPSTSLAPRLAADTVTLATRVSVSILGGRT